jgi:hypothetical protein
MDIKNLLLRYCCGPGSTVEYIREVSSGSDLFDAKLVIFRQYFEFSGSRDRVTKRASAVLKKIFLDFLDLDVSIFVKILNFYLLTNSVEVKSGQTCQCFLFFIFLSSSAHSHLACVIMGGGGG